MIVTCPACATRYTVDPSAISAEGRKVRCTRCSHVWRQMPPDDMPKRVDLLPTLSEMPSRERGGGAGWIILIIVLLLIATAVAAGYVGRERIVQKWPQLAPLYERVGIPVAAIGEGLELGEPTHVRRQQDGVEVIEIEGEIRNGTDGPIDVPNLLVVVRNVDNKAVSERTDTAPTASLAAG